MDRDTLYWIWLAQKLGAGSFKLTELIRKFGSAYEIYRIDPSHTAFIDRDRGHTAERLADKELTEANRICSICRENGIDIITYADERYPQRLRAIQNPPAVLYCRGLLPNFDRLLCISVVGTRKMSEYGCRATYTISYELANAGVITVSGMAMGVDGVVACAGFASGGHTVAVLGCGIDIVYPKCNSLIYSELIKHGTVISEYPPGTRATKYTFPLRNRIISGLCQGTFVVEGDRTSGSLITARLALLQGREVFALPGNVGESNSAGTNELIHDGAHPVGCTFDIIREYLPLYASVVDTRMLSEQGSRFDYDREILKRYGILPEFSYTGTNDNAPIEKKPIKRSVREARPVTEVKAKSPNTPEKVGADGSGREYERLEPSLKAVYDRMPSDRSVSADELVGDGIAIGEAIAALTMLELKGLVLSLPGGLYSRC